MVVIQVRGLGEVLLNGTNLQLARAYILGT